MAQRTAEERFWQKVDKSGGPDACWPWMASRHPSGHGQFWADGRRWTASSWILGHLRGRPLQCHGSRKGGDFGLHRCDNPPCVNPAHLYVGDQQRNVRDAVERGRHYSDNRGRSHCHRDHEFTPENTYRKPRSGTRLCRACMRLKDKRNQERRKKLRAEARLR